MRILILGAGGTGGYFGARLQQGGADVTFLAHEQTAAWLREHGLVLHSPLGDAQLEVNVVTADQLHEEVAIHPFDLILLSCKAYDLDDAARDIAPAMDGHAMLLPILNGLRHYAALDERFGAGQVLGGLAFISAGRNEQGEIEHLNRKASLTFGERHGNAQRARCAAFARQLEQAGVEHEHAAPIEQASWIKYTFLTTMAGANCLMRASLGDILATDDGEDFIRRLYAECCAVADAAGWPIPDAARQQALRVLTHAGSPLTASMLRDLQGGRRTEGAHIVGDMLQRARQAGQNAPLLSVVWTHLQVYEVGRRRRS